MKNHRQSVKKISILYVCMGNICRSPVAEGTMRNLVAKENLTPYFHIESCGTATFHIGSPPDARSQSVAKEYNISLESTAQKFSYDHFSVFDYIFAMDHDNYFEILSKARTEGDCAKIAMFRQFDPQATDTTISATLPESQPNTEFSQIASKESLYQQVKSIPAVPDPYYGGGNGFYDVQEMILRTCQNFLKILQSQYFSS